MRSESEGDTAMDETARPAPPVRTICYSHSAEVESARGFYADVLGFEVVMEHPVVGLVSPGNRTAQVLIPSAGSEQPAPSFGVDLGTVDAVERAHAAVLERGLRVVYPLTEESWGVLRFFVEDPGGTIVNVLAHRDHHADAGTTDG